MPTVSIDDLTFGAEFEVILPRRNNGESGRAALAEYLTANGIETRHESYNHALRRHWKIVTDATIGYENAEVVSPVLQGEEGLETIRRFCRLIDDHGCRVNRACGHHVHVGVRDRFGQQIGFFKELLKTYSKFQPVIDQLVAPSRRGVQTWSRPVSYTADMDRATTLDELARLAGAAHYTNPNFHDAFSRHGTIEFRQHQGTVNGDKSVNWIKLCLRLVAHAAKNDEMARVGQSSRDTLALPRTRYVPGTPTVRDLTQAPWITAEEMTNGRRRAMAHHWVIREIAVRNPRRVGTQRYDNWQYYHVGETVYQFIARGGRLDIARHDVAEGYVRIVDNSRAPIIAAAVPGRHEMIEPTIPAPALVSAPVPVPTINRPATDAAPATLDGLFDLIDVPEGERSFFYERQLELNP